MLLRLKLRIGALLIVAGGLLAACGEVLTLWNTNPLTGGWFVSMGLIMLGALALLYGINTYAQLSDDITLLGLGGTGLLALGGVALILGTMVLNVVVVPLLLAMAAAITTVLNAPGSAVQTATNSVTSGLNSVGNFFGSHSSIPSVQIPQADGIQIISNTLSSMHVPTIAALSHWGHVFSSGGPLTVGCLLLGLSLWKKASVPQLTSYGLIIAAGLTLLCQGLVLSPILPAVLGTPVLAITGMVLFLSLVLLGVSILVPQVVARLWPAQGAVQETSAPEPAIGDQAVQSS